MPLETATYISDLVTSNPAASDPLSGADDHLRLLKATIKTTFPNITGPVTATHTQLNTLGSGVTQLAAAGAHFRTNDFLDSPSAGRLDAYVDNAGAAQTLVELYSTSLRGGGATKGLAWIRGDLTVDGALVASDLTAPGAVPVGGMVMWLSDTLPSVGTWCWANGGTLSRTGNGARLFAVTGTTYGAGDGSTTFNVINMQEAAPVGKSTMGGAASPGLLASISAGVKAALGSVFGADTHQLTTPQLPTITPSGTITNGAITITHDAAKFVGGSIISNSSPGGAFQNTAATVTASQAASTFTGTAFGGNTAHNNVQPSRTVNFIIRIG